MRQALEALLHARPVTPLPVALNQRARQTEQGLGKETEGDAFWADGFGDNAPA